jgi:hypothetical protein
MAEELKFRHSGAAQRAKPGKRWAMPVNHINVEHCIPLEPAYPRTIAHIAGPEVDGVGAGLCVAVDLELARASTRR